MKIKHVYGNVLKLDIPLTIKIRTMEGDVPTEREEPFYPDVSKGCVVVLNNNYNRKMEYNASLSGNVAHIEDNGIIGIGTYKVTVKCYDEEGNPYRYMVRDIIEICDATIDAGIEAGVEFNAETYTLNGAVFISYGGEQVQSDWAETNPEEKSFIKNKPNLSVYATKEELENVEGEIPELPENLVTDANYVHTDNNYTNEEKGKLAELENYDDSGIRQELGGKVDKVAGKGLSTNDFTNEDKSKLNSALQSETDPTVPQWAKQPNKPSYTAQEVGALSNSTKYGSTIDLTMNSTTYVLTLSLKDQDGTVLNTKTVDLPIESVVVNGRYDAANKKIVLTLQSGSTIDVPVGDLIAGLQTEITSVNMLDADLVDDTNSTHKFVTTQEKQAWNNKSDFSGSYNDLLDKPTIPTTLSQLSEDTTHRTVSDTEKQTWNNKQDALDFETTPSSSNKVATMADMPTVMHASGSGHKGGLVPDTPSSAGNTKFLREDGTWAENSGLPSGGSTGDVLTMSANGAAWVAQAGIQDVDNLPSTGGAEIGYEIVSIVVTVDSGAPQGTTKSGLIINAYYNGATVPSDVATTDSDGFAQLLVPMGYQYKLVFPTQQGCRGIADVVHTASIAQRSVEVEYQEAAVEGETVKVILSQKNYATISKVSGATVNITYDGTTTAYTTDSQGMITATIPYGKQYTITAPQRQDWYLRGNTYTLSYTAGQSQRVVTYVYHSLTIGMYVVASDGAEYNLQEWEAAVEGGTRQNSEAMLIKIATSSLISAGGVFAIDIDMVRERTQGSNRAWASPNVQFNSIPLNGNSTSAAYYYDGLSASRLIQQEGDERSIDTLAADQCLAMSRTIAAGTESELTLPGFLGSVGQWNELWKNVTEIDDILLSTRPNGTYLISTWTTSKWTCTQSNANNAYYWGAAANGYGKSSSYVVLPFFAY